MADLLSVARAFVAALVSNSAAREAFSAAMHPLDPAKAMAAINEYSGAEAIGLTDVAAIVPLIGKALDAARAAGATDIPASIMPGDAGGATGTIMPGDSGDAGGSSGNIMGGDDEPKP